MTTSTEIKTWEQRLNAVAPSIRKKSREEAMRAEISDRRAENERLRAALEDRATAFNTMLNEQLAEKVELRAALAAAEAKLADGGRDAGLGDDMYSTIMGKALSSSGYRTYLNGDPLPVHPDVLNSIVRYTAAALAAQPSEQAAGLKGGA